MKTNKLLAIFMVLAIMLPSMINFMAYADEPADNIKPYEVPANLSEEYVLPIKVGYYNGFNFNPNFDPDNIIDENNYETIIDKVNTPDDFLYDTLFGKKDSVSTYLRDKLSKKIAPYTIISPNPTGTKKLQSSYLHYPELEAFDFTPDDHKAIINDLFERGIINGNDTVDPQTFKPILAINDQGKVIRKLTILYILPSDIPVDNIDAHPEDGYIVVKENIFTKKNGSTNPTAYVDIAQDYHKLMNYYPHGDYIDANGIRYESNEVINMKVGDKFDLEAFFYASKANDTDFDTKDFKLKWNSSNDEIIKINYGPYVDKDMNEHGGYSKNNNKVTIEALPGGGQNSTVYINVTELYSDPLNDSITLEIHVEYPKEGDLSTLITGVPSEMFEEEVYNRLEIHLPNELKTPDILGFECIPDGLISFSFTEKYDILTASKLPDGKEQTAYIRFWRKDRPNDEMRYKILVKPKDPPKPPEPPKPPKPPTTPQSIEDTLYGDGPIIIKLYTTIDIENVFVVRPDTAKDKRLRYYVHDTDIVQFNQQKMQLRGMQLGKTKLTIKAANGITLTKIIYVTKDGEPPTGEDEVTGVSFDRETYNIRVDDVIRLKPSITPFTAANTECTWETSNEEIAEVDEYGNVKGKSKGTAAITVTTEDNGYKAVARVTVRPYYSDEEADEDPYHFKNDPQYDPRAFEKELDVEKIKRIIDHSDTRDITIKLGSEFILPAELIEYIRDSERNVTFEHTNYKWILNFRDIPEGDIHKDMNLHVTNRSPYKKEITALLTENSNPQFIDFAHDGEMPVKMTFMYRSNRSADKKGFYFYNYNSGFDTLELVDEKLRTDFSRYVSIPLKRCSSSVLTSSPQSSNNYTRYNPLTGK